MMTFEKFNERYERLQNAISNLLVVMTEVAYDYGFSVKGKLAINNKEGEETNIGIEREININE